MPVFKNQDNFVFDVLPDGHYPFTVTGMECGIQTTGKTVGSPYWDLKLDFEHQGKKSIVRKKLIDHPSCDRYIDTFLKTTGASPEFGKAFDFSKETAESSGILWIDPIGLRGWAALTTGEMPAKGNYPARKVNEVAAFLTDKPKLPRHVDPAAAPAPEPAAAADDEPLF